MIKSNYDITLKFINIKDGMKQSKLCKNLNFDKNGR